MAIPRQGRIVWALMRDSQGRNAKLRPGVIVSSNDEVEREGRFFVAAITTSIAEPLSEWEVLLPWNRSGTTRTKLKKKAAAVCNWLVELSPAEVENYGGIVPARLMNEILERISRLSK